MKSGLRLGKKAARPDGEWQWEWVVYFIFKCGGILCQCLGIICHIQPPQEWEKGSKEFPVWQGQKRPTQTLGQEVKSSLARSWYILLRLVCSLCSTIYNQSPDAHLFLKFTRLRCMCSIDRQTCIIDECTNESYPTGLILSAAGIVVSQTYRHQCVLLVSRKKKHPNKEILFKIVSSLHSLSSRLKCLQCLTSEQILVPSTLIVRVVPVPFNLVRIPSSDSVSVLS